MVVFDTSSALWARRFALAAAVLLLVLEPGAIGVIFKHAIDFRCLDNWPAQACSGASFTLVSLYCVAAAVALMAMLKPEPFRRLAVNVGDVLWPLVLNGLGVAIALVPLFFMKQGAATAILLPAFGCWCVGTVLMLGGLARFVAPVSRWQDFVVNNFSTLIPVLLTGMAAPWLAAEIRPIWRLEAIAAATFEAVAALVRVLGYDIETPPGTKIIGTDAFAINVAPQCSGVEGFALVTLFVTLYLWLFRFDLRFPRALLLYPVGLAASAAFNVIRISALLVIGLEGNPELAVGGFHSHAGWLMFTLVALGIVALAQTQSWLQKPLPVVRADTHRAARPAPNGTTLPPFWKDPQVARILPFAVFMLSALLAQSFSQSPSVIYPLRVLAMGAVLLLFAPILLRLPWRINRTGLALGFAVGLMWVLMPVVPSDGPQPYGALSGMLLIGWFVLRGVGTIVLVPVIEELFFRGYLETRLRLRDGLAWKLLASVVTAGLFAALHDRWAEAFVAGLAFSYAAYRPEGKLTDAIIAHAVANALVFAVAVSTGQIHII